MKKYIHKIKEGLRKGRKGLNPNKPEERRRMIAEAVERTVREYGEALRKLEAD